MPSSPLAPRPCGHPTLAPRPPPALPAAAVFPELAAVGLTAARVTLAPCSMLAPHYHPNAEEIAHVLSGGRGGPAAGLTMLLLHGSLVHLLCNPFPPSPVCAGKATAVQFNESGHQFVTNLTAGDVQVVPAGAAAGLPAHASGGIAALNTLRRCTASSPRPEWDCTSQTRACTCSPAPPQACCTASSTRTASCWWGTLFGQPTSCCGCHPWSKCWPCQSRRCTVRGGSGAGQQHRHPGGLARMRCQC